MFYRQSPVLLLGAGFVALAAALTHTGLGAQAPQTPPSAEAIDLFETKVRPIFAEHCFTCHTDNEMGDLRVDSREALLKGGASGPAIVAGNPDASLLMRAVRREAGAPQMPMDSAKLSDAEIGALAEWIRLGAPWASADAKKVVAAERPITAEHRAFWSFQPLHPSAVPAVADTAWPKSDIDRFILSRLEREGLAPVKPADKRTLIKRATLDLTGLPATLDEIEAFEKDSSPEAFATVVDRLLASPHYGEHWGRRWLDVARYGEDDPRSLDPMGRGYAPYPNAYLYRDWVIKALNDDLPYDQFVRAQLAGDLMDEPTRARMLPALGFLGIGPWYYDNGAVEITRADERHDRVDVVSRGFLGLTVACARCHDHKYDPIPTRDYYGLAGVFLNSPYHEYPQAPASVVEEYKAQEKKIKNREKLLGEFMSKERQQLAEALTLQAARYMQAAWRVTGEPKKDKATVVNDEKLDYELFDRWLYFLAKPPTFYPFVKPWQDMIANKGGTAAEAKKLAEELQALLVEVMFQHKEIEEENDIIRAKALPGTKKPEPHNKPNEFVTNDDFCPGCGLELKAMPTDRTQLWTDVYQRDLAEGPEAQKLERPKPPLLGFTGWSLERQLSAERRQYINDLREDIKALRKALPPQYAYVHGVRDVEKPTELPLAIRGNPNRLGDPVPRRFLSVLGPADAPVPLTASGSGRLALAEQILRQPLTTRVIVNRIWKGHFGTGIVNTPSNFGQIGERPSHPELLEHLSQWFIDNGRSIKKLHRAIMLSAVYQLASTDVPAYLAKDPDNRLYWRVSRRRMTAEEIRDSLLSVSGEIDRKIGGPSAELTPSYKRRTVYGRVSRYRLDQFLQLFDFPAATISAEQRFSTNVPLQRLFFMNSDFVQQQSELIARTLQEEPDNAARITRAYKLIYGRTPVEAELEAGLDYLSAEPMRAYTERRAAQDAAKAEKEKPGAADKPAAADDADERREGDGMMAGVVPGAGKPEDKAKLLPVTPLGRYLKILLSSNEFLFID